MTAKKTELSDSSRKRKRIVPTRAAGTPAFENPADELFAAAFANRKAKETTANNLPTLPYPTVGQSTLDNPTLPEPGIAKKELTVSPSRNFTKFSNSLVKQAIPDGLFRGQSKHTYDVLYLHTRGAINPVRQVQLTKSELVQLTGLEIKTIQRHLSFLRSTGLITVDPKVGDHKGAFYEVNIPEELTIPYPTLGQSTLVESSVGQASVLSTPDPSINYTTVGYGLKPENTGQNTPLKTSLKTNTRKDDEPFGAMNDVLRKMSEKATGKFMAKNESEKWMELADLLVMEFNIAAARTGPISSVPAFLCEHLRRRLIQKITAPKSKVEKPSPSKSEESELNVYEAEPLSQQGREVVLKTFKEYVEKGQRDFVLSFKETYTEEDWQFLMENIK